ncbi:hypothetical protein EYF80_050185 [Liparis tanakae]|uniref:Uncharacterized protein n=1 Tax=Liparis tanakae TaxID=230148 RepID=A0A4Z2FFX7_9TELE|nr:hypothetical protein EYF80_050185 [Liparis tanakae]
MIVAGRATDTGAKHRHKRSAYGEQLKGPCLGAFWRAGADLLHSPLPVMRSRVERDCDEGETEHGDG